MGRASAAELVHQCSGDALVTAEQNAAQQGGLRFWQRRGDELVGAQPDGIEQGQQGIAPVVGQHADAGVAHGGVNALPGQPVPIERCCRCPGSAQCAPELELVAIVILVEARHLNQHQAAAGRPSVCQVTC